MTVVDRQLGVQWRAPYIDLDVLRRRRGGADGTAVIGLALADQTAQLTLRAALPGNGGSIAVSGELTQIRPAALAAAAPALADLAALDVPVVLTGSAEIGADLALAGARLQARLGKGAIRIGRGQVSLVGATVDLAGSLSALEARLVRAEVVPREDGPVSVLTGQVKAERAGGQVRATVGVELDQVAFADLATLWPDGIGGPGTKPWITTNITAGIARNGRVELSLTAPEDLSDAELTAISGGIEGHDVTVHWLRPVPPIEHGEAYLSFRTPDLIEIAVQSGRQAGGARGGIALQAGSVRLSGLAAHDQFADIEGDMSGPVSDVLALLRHPKLRLLDRHPIEMRDPAGQFAGHLTVTRLPLQDDVSIDDLRIAATARLRNLHLGGVAVGRDLDNGTLELRASNDDLKITGTGDIAGIPTKYQVEMDFRSGPPSQVLQKVSVSGTVDARQAEAAGLATGGLVSGSAAVQANVQARRDGRGEITVRADLAGTTMQLARLNWKKPAGRPASADMHVVLAGDRLAAIDRLQIQGEGIDLDARIEFADGKPVRARLPRLVLGKTTDLQGDVRWPARPGAPWMISASGPSLDVSSQFERHASTPPKPADSQPGPPWSLDAQFDRVVLGDGRTLSGVVVAADNDGRITRQASVSGRTAAAPFDLSITPAPGGRHLSGTTKDAGGLLRALDVVDSMQGGLMTLSGSYDDARPDNPLSGTAEITDFHMRKAPALAKLLQAMTLYGLVAAVQGPGLGFDHLVAPFRLVGDNLELNDARAFNPSLGMTAKGRLDLAKESCDVQGTIVPAYFFNTLLGHIPLVGRLFSPERGGGLFAATYTVQGNCNDPSVTVNPLAALTPGFLRGIFGIFDQPAGSKSPAAVPPADNKQGSRN
nr:AsmA-like C-terminal region-containing protein [Limobrevibacterium gyesilva]